MYQSRTEFVFSIDKGKPDIPAFRIWTTEGAPNDVEATVGTAVIEDVDGSPRFRISPEVIISWALNDTTPGIPKMERRKVG